VSRWSVEGHRAARVAHMRKARRSAEFARDPNCDKTTRTIWREHARQHVKAARREHWLLVAQSRAMSAGMFLRKTIGAHGGHVWH
jgi:hypothetical protein